MNVKFNVHANVNVKINVHANVNIKFKEGTLNLKIDKELNIFMRGPVSDIKNITLEI